MYQRQLIEIDPQRITFNPLNTRKHRGTELIRLRESIKSIGIIQLPTVRIMPGGFYEVVDGEGRVTIAQEEGFEKIWVVSVGIINDREALMMLQSANTMRSYNFIAECKGLANLHRQGTSNSQLAKQFSTNASKINSMVAVGHFPQQLLLRVEEHISQSESELWTYSMLDNVLPLRELIPGKTIQAGNNHEWISLDGLYDYGEVNKAIEQVIGGKIKTREEMHTYVIGRKYEIFQQRFDQDLQERLEKELQQKREELEKIKTQHIYEFEEKTKNFYAFEISALESQRDDFKKKLDAAASDVAKKPDSVKQLEEKLRDELEKAREKREELYERLQQAQEDKERYLRDKQAEAQRAQERWEQESRQLLEDELKAQEREQKEKLKSSEERLKTYYAQQDRDRQLKAENTVRGLLSHGIKTLAEAQQIIEHIISNGMLPGVQQMGGAQQDSLIAQIKSMYETLDRAEEKLIRRNLALHVEGRIASGYND